VPDVPSAPAGRFATDTAVTQVAPGQWRARLDRGWWIQRGPNGGYLAAILQRAVRAAVDDPARATRSLTVHYLRPPAEGFVDVDVTVERTGRSVSTVSARMTQDGATVALALTALTADRSGAADFDDTAMPDVAPPDRCPPLPDGPGTPSIPIRGRYETRLAVGGPMFTEGPTARTGGWIRFADGEPLDELGVIALTDAWPPAVFTRVVGPLAVPTVDLTVHLRHPVRDPAAWSLVVFTTRVSAAGYLEEDGEVWSEDGRLLAQSRQLAVAV
jgi:acyl-CoA thioesterase